MSARAIASAERFALILTQPFATLRRRVNAWIATRTPRVPGPWVINRRRVYIVPTSYGYGFAALLLVMLLGAMNYSNSMAFALTFLLAGLGLLGMHYTHANLVNVAVRAGRAAPVFAGETARFPLALDNASNSPRYALAAVWSEAEPDAHGDVPAHGGVDLALALPATRRGWLPAPRFAVQTEFPLGLFHAWTWVELDMRCLVYPQPAEAGPQPSGASGGSGTKSGRRAGQEEFAGLRGYERGDASRRIHWKSLPRLRTPMVKQFAETLEREHWLDWNELPAGWDVERRLSQLARWVLDADAASRPYGLKLPQVQLAPALGETHRHECLKALALFGEGGDGRP